MQVTESGLEDANSFFTLKSQISSSQSILRPSRRLLNLISASLFVSFHDAFVAKDWRRIEGLKATGNEKKFSNEAMKMLGCNSKCGAGTSAVRAGQCGRDQRRFNRCRCCHFRNASQWRETGASRPRIEIAPCLSNDESDTDLSHLVHGVQLLRDMRAAIVNQSGKRLLFYVELAGTGAARSAAEMHCA